MVVFVLHCAWETCLRLTPTRICLVHPSTSFLYAWFEHVRVSDIHDCTWKKTSALKRNEWRQYAREYWMLLLNSGKIELMQIINKRERANASETPFSPPLRLSASLPYLHCVRAHEAHALKWHHSLWTACEPYHVTSFAASKDLRSASRQCY